MKFWDLETPKADIIIDTENPPSAAQPNRTLAIKELFRELTLRRYATRVNLVGEAALLELDMGATQRPMDDLDCVKTLGEITETAGPMPNEEMLNLSEKEKELELTSGF